MTLTLLSCHKEDIETLKTTDTDFASFSRPGDSQCDLDYVFPILHPSDPGANMYITAQITYNRDLTLEQIHCIRYEYFTAHPEYGDMRLCILQPTDPYLDCWKFIPGYPDQQTNTTICDDPRFTGAHCD